MGGRLLSGAARSVVVLVLGGTAANLLAPASVHATDLATAAPSASPLPPWSWTGFYAGVHSTAFGGNTKFLDPFGASIFGDKASTPGFGGGGQIGYNWQTRNWVFGLEADATWLSSDSTATCGAYSGFYGSATCGARPDANGTVTGRIGYALGTEAHTLAYVKGGLAWQHTDVTATNNNSFGLPPQTNVTSLTEPGWTVGAGVEYALTPAWSVRFEYDYQNFGGQADVTIPASELATQATVLVGPRRTPLHVPSFELTNPATSAVSSDVHMFKLGLNYKIGQDPWSSMFNVPVPGKSPALASGWEFEGGGRYWYSWGKAQKDLPGNLANDKSLDSRLTWDNMTANTGEVFGRVDTPVNLFLKGYLGGGGINSGRLNDEDWGLLSVFNSALAPVGYSNTVSSVAGSLSYGTIDLGYDVFRGRDYKAGAFVGYNRYSYTMNAGGCVQIANAMSDCAGTAAAPTVPTSTVGIIERDSWDSLRVGASADMTLFDRLKLSGEIAYVPYTRFTGADDHTQRNLALDLQGHGQGIQAEAFLSWQATDALSVGVGGRYWSLWTTSATDTVAGVVEARNDTFRTERLGAMVQTSYRFDTPARRSASPGWEAPAKAPHSSDWTGFYVGVHGGYGWGDTVFAGRPGLDAMPQGDLAGLQTGYNWQFGQVVAGVESDLSWADIKQSSVTTNVLTNLLTGAQFPLSRAVTFDDLATVRARLGYAVSPDVLAYATAGGAWGHSTGTFWTAGGALYDTWSPDGFGWSAGAGIEYRLTEHLLVRGEYLHYGFNSFSYDRADIDPHTVTGTTGIDISRAGLSYKF